MSSLSANATAIRLDDCTLETCPLSMARVTYIPSLPVNATFCGIFAFYMIIQSAQFARYKTTGYSIGMSLGLALEVLGYGARIAMHFNPFIKMTFIIQLIGLTLGPAFLSAAIYLCFGRIVVVYGEHISRIKSSMYTIIFVICDVVSLLLQAIGGALASTGSTQEDVDTGVHVMIAGLVAQVASLTVFGILSADFALRVGKRRGDLDSRHLHVREQPMWKWHLIEIFVASIAIYIRSVYRIAELWGGFRSALANDQVTFIVFEGVMLIIATTCQTAFHPGFVLRHFRGSLGGRQQPDSSKEEASSEYNLMNTAN